jgi:hypothetical protein
MWDENRSLGWSYCPPSHLLPGKLRHLDGQACVRDHCVVRGYRGPHEVLYRHGAVVRIVAVEVLISILSILSQPLAVVPDNI